MAKALEMNPSAFTRKYCSRSDGIWHLKANPDGPECLFLNSKNQCDVYKGRPIQCRTWPFWPENMNARTWRRDVARFCPGVGKGRLVSSRRIQQSLNEQKISELEIFQPNQFEDILIP